MLIGPVYGLLQTNEISEVDTGSQEFWLFPLSSKTFSVSCQTGDILSGQFTVTIDGDMYYGDQQKYDLWVGWGAGVDFHILNQSNKELYLMGEPFDSFYYVSDATNLSWSIEVPTSGEWYIIYENDSAVYGKQIATSVSQNSRFLEILPVIISLLMFGVISSLAYSIIKNTSKKG